MEDGNGFEIGEFHLPLDIIQHIQSFLNGKQAARTNTLSKLWYEAWLTLPILDLDEFNFSKCRTGGPKFQIADGFHEFSRNTMRRYQELNRKIDRFRLSMKNLLGRNSLANELIVKALNMGVNEFNFEINPPDTTFVLPHEVLEFENLTSLSVSGCKLTPRVNRKIRCSKLKVLSLSKVYIVDNIIWDITSSCPLIEKLSLTNCECLDELATLGRIVTNMRRWRTPSIESCEFHRLKSLSLYKATVDSLFFHNFSRKFPCLEDLSVLCCYGFEEIRLSSHSLKCIIIERKGIWWAEFDVPSIHKFMCSGTRIPSLSFPTASGEWESNITISCSDYRICAQWFGNMKKLLTNLSPSKISLNLKFYLEKYIDCRAGLIDGLAKPVVENLMVSVDTRSALCSSLLDGLFWCCRPKFITQYLSPRSSKTDKENNDFLELICKKLTPEVRHNMLHLHDLEEVDVEVFEQTLAEWQPLPWESLLHASVDPETAKRIRFRLKWIT